MAIDDKISDLRANILMKPYAEKNCVYLEDSDIDYPYALGQFSIPESCYIQDTGHFNAVEAIICYNQLAYQLFAEGLDKGQVKNVRRIPFDEFLQYQLPNSLIARVDNLRFKKQIDARNFYGSIEVNKSSTRKSNMFATTEFNFWDDNNGKASGELILAMGGF